MTIQIPQPVQHVLDVLTQQHHEAYIVGGCVRDSLLGKIPADWDVTTSALPHEILSAFQRQTEDRIIETGLKHGTLTVLTGDKHVEVTTYRIDGCYSDNRHPDTVHFTKQLSEDLCRRDFTINAMAYSSEEGLIDFYSGQKDLEKGLIRCVGVPDIRFREDALRILRAVRFSSVLRFPIEPATAAALQRNRDTLTHVAVERIAEELNKLLCGQDVRRVMLEYSDILSVAIPELAPMVGFAQHNPYHAYDVYEHTAICVESVPPSPLIRLVALFHDIGKPSCYTQDEKGIGHFYGHQSASTTIARSVLMRLHYDNQTIDRVCRLVTYHDVWIENDERLVKRWLNRLGEEDFRLLLEMKKADIRGQAPHLISRLEEIEALTVTLEKVLAENQCFSLKSLAVNGHDLITIGLYPGKLLGDILQALLNDVIENRLPNDKTHLLERAKELKETHTY